MLCKPSMPADACELSLLGSTVEQSVVHGLSGFLRASELARLVSSCSSLGGRLRNSGTQVCWKQAYYNEWPNDDASGPLSPADAEWSSPAEEATWIRQGAWFARRFMASPDWFANCARRASYARAVRAAVARGALGFFDADLEPKLQFDGKTKADGGSMHWALHNTDIPGTFERRWPKISFFMDELDSPECEDLISKVMVAFLELSAPDAAFANMDIEHRYEWFFPHVLQLGPAHVEASAASIVFGGSSETVRADLAFGMLVCTWQIPVYVELWGKDLVEAIERDPPLVFSKVELTRGEWAGQTQGPRDLNEKQANSLESAAKALGQVNATNWARVPKTQKKGKQKAS